MRCCGDSLCVNRFGAVTKVRSQTTQVFGKLLVVIIPLFVCVWCVWVLLTAYAIFSFYKLMERWLGTTAEMQEKLKAKQKLVYHLKPFCCFPPWKARTCVRAVVCVELLAPKPSRSDVVLVQGVHPPLPLRRVSVRRHQGVPYSADFHPCGTPGSLCICPAVLPSWGS